MTWQDKLKHEWKTAALAVTSALVFGYDGILAAGYNWTKLIPEGYHDEAAAGVFVLMLLLRRWVPKAED